MSVQGNMNGFMQDFTNLANSFQGAASGYVQLRGLQEKLETDRLSYEAQKVCDSVLQRMNTPQYTVDQNTGEMVENPDHIGVANWTQVQEDMKNRLSDIAESSAFSSVKGAVAENVYNSYRGFLADTSRFMYQKEVMNTYTGVLDNSQKLVASGDAAGAAKTLDMAKNIEDFSSEMRSTLEVGRDNVVGRQLAESLANSKDAESQIASASEVQLMGKDGKATSFAATPGAKAAAQARLKEIWGAQDTEIKQKGWGMAAELGALASKYTTVKEWTTSPEAELLRKKFNDMRADPANKATVQRTSKDMEAIASSMTKFASSDDKTSADKVMLYAVTARVNKAMEDAKLTGGNKDAAIRDLVKIGRGEVGITKLFGREYTQQEIQEIPGIQALLNRATDEGMKLADENNITVPGAGTSDFKRDWGDPLDVFTVGNKAYKDVFKVDGKISESLKISAITLAQQELPSGADRNDVIKYAADIALHEKRVADLRVADLAGAEYKKKTVIGEGAAEKDGLFSSAGTGSAVNDVMRLVDTGGLRANGSGGDITPEGFKKFSDSLAAVAPKVAARDLEDVYGFANVKQQKDGSITYDQKDSKGNVVNSYIATISRAENSDDMILTARDKNTREVTGYRSINAGEAESGKSIVLGEWYQNERDALKSTGGRAKK